MKILLHGIGSLGDLHPVMGLAKALQSRGHEVIVASCKGYREKVEGAGISFLGVSPELDPQNADLARRAMDPKNGSQVVMSEITDGCVRESYNDLLPLKDWPDLIITGPLSFPAILLAKKFGIKWVSMELAPISLFSRFDPSIFANARWMHPLQKIWGSVGHRFFLELITLVTKRWIKNLRSLQQELGITDYERHLSVGQFSPYLNLAMFSPFLGEPQKDWPANTVQTGFVFYDRDVGAEPTVALAKFLDAGDAPIVFTLGSAAVAVAEDYFRSAAAAARKIGRRAVLIYGRDYEENVRGIEVQDDLLLLPYAPFSVVFPRASVIVHQGGVGTCAQTLRAGRPSLVVPFSHDQFDNAERLRRLGVADVLLRHKLSADALATKLLHIIESRGMKDIAVAAANRISRENGADAAVAAIESLQNA
jgi:rhamnosyltransferase subunit B